MDGIWQYEEVRAVTYFAAALFLIAAAVVIYFCREERRYTWPLSFAWGAIGGVAANIVAYGLFFKSMLDHGLRNISGG